MWHNVGNYTSCGISRCGRQIAGKNIPDGREIDLIKRNAAEKCCEKCNRDNVHKTSYYIIGTVFSKIYCACI